MNYVEFLCFFFKFRLLCVDFYYVNTYCHHFVFDFAFKKSHMNPKRDKDFVNKVFKMLKKMMKITNLSICIYSKQI
jgi:hypothetical protein